MGKVIVIFFIISCIQGLALAIAIALYRVSSDVIKFNDIGDSSGSLRDFGQLNIITAENGLLHKVSFEQEADMQSFSDPL